MCTGGPRRARGGDRVQGPALPGPDGGPAVLAAWPESCHGGRLTALTPPSARVAPQGREGPRGGLPARRGACWSLPLLCPARACSLARSNKSIFV